MTHRLLPKQDAGTDDTAPGDSTELKWEFDEDSGRYYVSFPDDQQWSPVGVDRGLLSHLGFFFYFGSVDGPWLYLVDVML